LASGAERDDPPDQDRRQFEIDAIRDTRNGTEAAAGSTGAPLRDIA
jgi:hypothetical protein